MRSKRWTAGPRYHIFSQGRRHTPMHRTSVWRHGRRANALLDSMSEGYRYVVTFPDL